jgi:hypothetical protein
MHPLLVAPAPHSCRVPSPHFQEEFLLLNCCLRLLGVYSTTVLAVWL